jgi:hypothetical protein
MIGIVQFEMSKFAEKLATPRRLNCSLIFASGAAGMIAATYASLMSFTAQQSIQREWAHFLPSRSPLAHRPKFIATTFLCIAPGKLCTSTIYLCGRKQIALGSNRAELTLPGA